MPTLSVDQQITFLYTPNLEVTAHFYETVLGLRLWRDQGTCRIYHVSADGFLGVCERADAVIDPQRRDLIFTIITQEVDHWYEHLRAHGAAFEQPPALNARYNIYHCFLRDPNGYLIEIQRFVD